MTMYLGVSSGHDSSICFYKNGKIEYFIKEERRVGRKREKDPVACLNDFVISEDVVYCYSAPGEFGSGYDVNRYLTSKKYNIFRSYNYNPEHHLIHANLAFYDSGFDKALVFVVDRNGSFAYPTQDMSNLANEVQSLYSACRESESVYIAEYPNNFTPIYKNYWVNNHQAYHVVQGLSKKNPDCEYSAKSMQSIVKVYETATSLIMQDNLENGKTMGLSAYGTKNIKYDTFFTEDSIALDHFFGHEIIYPPVPYAINLKMQNLAQKNITKENYRPYADYAWQVQKQTQEALANLVNKYVEKTGIKKVCITGGYGLNVVANYYLITQFPDIDFFFEPLADDSGNSIGAAMKAYRDETLDTNIYPLRDTFFNGKIYGFDHSIGKTVSTEDIANLIANGKSVAVYEGLAEAGPRALGHRSILFDPRDKEAKDKVNKIKNREWYRPFAGMVLESDASNYFEMGRITKSPYMTISFPVKENSIKNIPGVVHVDNTCRVQTVDQSNYNMFNLLTKFKEITGIGVILNTSFNLAGKPLVETPKDAVDTLLNSPLDFIWFPESQKIVSKSDLQLR